MAAIDQRQPGQARHEIMEKRNFDLLRPFDLEAAKAGAPLFYTRPENGENECVFISQAGNEVCVHFKEFGFSIYDDSDVADKLRMAPLAWVEGKPVYKGDVLWHTARGAKVIADKVSSNGSLIEPGCTAGDYLSNLTWTPPKVKREVKLLGYRHDKTGKIALLEQHPNPPWDMTRVESLDTTIEVEE